MRQAHRHSRHVAPGAGASMLRLNSAPDARWKTVGVVGAEVTGMKCSAGAPEALAEPHGTPAPHLLRLAPAASRRLGARLIDLAAFVPLDGCCCALGALHRHHDGLEALFDGLRGRQAGKSMADRGDCGLQAACAPGSPPAGRRTVPAASTGPRMLQACRNAASLARRWPGQAAGGAHLCKGQLSHAAAVQAGKQGVQLSRGGEGAPPALRGCKSPVEGECGAGSAKRPAGCTRGRQWQFTQGHRQPASHRFWPSNPGLEPS